jgi:hypothetical protein
VADGLLTPRLLGQGSDAGAHYAAGSTPPSGELSPHPMSLTYAARAICR